MNDNIKNIMQKIKSFKLKQLLSFSGYFISALIILNGYSFEFFQKTFGVGSSGGDGLIWIAYFFLYWASGFISIQCYKKNNKNPHCYYFIILFIMLFFQMYLYLFLISYYTKVYSLLNPVIFFPLFISFLAVVINKKHYKLYTFILFFIPLVIIINDFVQTQYFLLTCEEKTPAPIYTPLYLPDEYFHEEIIGGEKFLAPNVIEIKTYKEDQNTNNTIYI